MRAGEVAAPDTIYPRELLGQLKQIYGVGSRSLFEGMDAMSRAD
jgi:hypothetical protein